MHCMAHSSTNGVAVAWCCMALHGVALCCTAERFILCIFLFALGLNESQSVLRLRGIVKAAALFISIQSIQSIHSSRHVMSLIKRL